MSILSQGMQKYLPSTSRFALAAFILVFAAASTWFFATSHASAPTSSLEAENGTVSSAANKINNSSASGGQAVKFGDGTGDVITNGTQINASNTGLAEDGISESSLTPAGSGSTTYDSSFNGQTISDMSFTGRVNISGNNITLKDCKVLNGGLNTFGINITGDNVTVENCVITAPAGESLYEPIMVNGSADGAVITRNDISRGNNLLTTYGTNVTISENYLHDVSLDSDPTNHPDAIEVYGGAAISIARNNINEVGFGDAPINVAPWSSGNPSVTGLDIVDNFLDGGNAHILIDAQASGGNVYSVRVLRNIMGGHTQPGVFGIYAPFQNEDHRPTVETQAEADANTLAVLWPTSGADANHWGECSDLTPDKTGQVVDP